MMVCMKKTKCIDCKIPLICNTIHLDGKHRNNSRCTPCLSKKFQQIEKEKLIRWKNLVK